MDEQPTDLTILGGGLAGLSLALQVTAASPPRQHYGVGKAFASCAGGSAQSRRIDRRGCGPLFRTHPRTPGAHPRPTVAKAWLAIFLSVRRQLARSKIDWNLAANATLRAQAISSIVDGSRTTSLIAAWSREFAFCSKRRSKRSTSSGGDRIACITRLPANRIHVASRWVVDASGRRAFLKRKLGLAKKSPHRANAAWFRFKKHIKVDDWSDNQDWHQGHEGKTARWYSTNHLMGQGYWVWLIPLASGSTSMGIVAAEEFHSAVGYQFDGEGCRVAGKARAAMRRRPSSSILTSYKTSAPSSTTRSNAIRYSPVSVGASPARQDSFTIRFTLPAATSLRSPIRF